jgi:hypothetical protein
MRALGTRERGWAGCVPDAGGVHVYEVLSDFMSL